MHSKQYTLLQNSVKNSRFCQKLLVVLLLVLVVYLVLRSVSEGDRWRSSDSEESPTGRWRSRDVTESPGDMRSSPMVSTDKSTLLMDTLKAVIRGYNKIGQAVFSEELHWTSLIVESFNEISHDNPEYGSLQNLILNLIETDIMVMREAHKVNKAKRIRKTGPMINLATVLCGEGRLAQGLTMIKSASMFAQDASLNVIAFSDAETIITLGMELFLLRRMVNIAGWDFTFELHLEWFPTHTSGKSWREMYQPCATMRLFFPDLLPHIDSIIYMDTDVVVVSNMTELWNKISTEMGETKLAAAAPNTEPDSVNYYTYNRLPHPGKQGINAGIMLMNLTQMRLFNFSNRATGIKNAYAEKLMLADQDIYNAIFQVYDDRFHLLSCTYNLYYVHCLEGAACNRETERNTCFCEDARENGMHVIHGCFGTFWSFERDHFIPQVYRNFENFDVILETPLKLLAKIKQEFKPQSKCYNVDYDMVYKNAQNYLTKLYEMN